MFAERLDEIMKIAGVSNTVLGRALSISGSHIGRLRSGARALPKEHDFLAPMCDYLAQHITKDHQLTALVNLTGMDGEAVSSAQRMASFLENWLQEKVGDGNAAGRFVSGFSYFAAGAMPAVSHAESVEGVAREDRALYYYGNAGKRRAVIRFFHAILQETEPQTLLLFSDEPFTWLYEDAAFAKQWFSLFFSVLQRGNRVKIIHTINRDMDEMIEGLTRWIPVYMTGAIEPYYYPRLRDGVFQRTLFIAPNTAAVASSSVQQNTNGNLNRYVEDKAAVAALTSELEQFLSLCRPLMKIFLPQNASTFLRDIETLKSAQGDCVLSCAMPLIFSMPEALAKEIAEKQKSPTFVELWKKSLTVFRSTVKKSQITEVVLSPTVARLRPDVLMLPMGDMLLPSGFRYTEEQYLAHLVRLHKLEAQYPNFTVIEKDELPANMLICHKEDVRALVAKTTAPSLAFLIGEQNMVAALGDYLKKGME